METNKPVIVGIGELLWDMLPTGKRDGGVPINFVYHATRMGAEGSKYSSIYTSGEKSFIPTPKIEVVDTVGAGDSFSGAFVYSILTGKSLAKAHQTAVDTAAFVCTKEGAWPTYPNQDRQ